MSRLDSGIDRTEQINLRWQGVRGLLEEYLKRITSWEQHKKLWLSAESDTPERVVLGALRDLAFRTPPIGGSAGELVDWKELKNFTEKEFLSHVEESNSRSLALAEEVFMYDASQPNQKDKQAIRCMVEFIRTLKALIHTDRYWNKPISKAANN